MLTEESKKRIEAMSVSEIAYEIELGTRSRFQREKMAYLKLTYQIRMDAEAAKGIPKSRWEILANLIKEISNKVLVAVLTAIALPIIYWAWALVPNLF